MQFYFRLNAFMLLFIGFILLAIMLMRTARFTRPPYTYPPLPPPKCEADIAAEHLAEALRFRTITLTNQPPPEPEAFTAFHAWLEQRYPRVHASLDACASAITANFIFGTEKTLNLPRCSSQPS